MKKTERFPIIAIAILIALIIAFPFWLVKQLKSDDSPAVVEIETTQSGQTIQERSWNGLRGRKTGFQWAIEKACTVVSQGEEDLLKVHFFCEKCGHDEVRELKGSTYELLFCDCPENGDDSNNAKEYFYIVSTLEG